ncbi:MAG TPA: hemerythrin family protein [Candidatus Eisenbergiella pullistercoris]|uniref:Hemerythrin family protein n=1 Tax=Candidatus Eisenbergiella pullistercoris TaxID=2838555 RepID=A0A9D2C4Z0_9FIRM|nr:hemerythrin family protein [Candidatus Eisenbergiella pullistercoris]
MKHYEISDEYRTGNDRIDQQHAKMLDYTWRAHELFADENMLFKADDIRKILEGLEYYTVVHFAEEEEFMERIGFDGRKEHIGQHEAFREKIRGFIARVPELSLATQDDMLGEVFEYLQEWWKVHITHEDRKYVDFERKNGMLPEEV